MEIYFDSVRKHCWKSRKYWLPAYSPFPTMFSKGFFCRTYKPGIDWERVKDIIKVVMTTENLLHQLAINIGKYLSQKGKVCEINFR